MPQPLRKVRQRIPRTAVRPPRVLLHLPFLGVAALLVVFAVAVGWAFFMGVIIGQGQNPAERVSAMLHEPSPEVVPPDRLTAGEVMSELLDHPLPLRNGSQGERTEAAAGSGGEDPAGASDGQGAAPQAQEAQPASGQTASGQPASGQTVSGQTAQGRKPQEQPAQAATEESKASAYPFARPQGESLAAWGIQPSGPQGAQQAATQDGAKAQPSGQQAAEKAEQKSAAKAEPKFDYVYQAAAFRGKEDGDALRVRLEEKGLRTRLQKSGKVYLVQVLLRGSEREAENVRETLRRMGLGKPIRLSKKAVK